MLKIRLQRIGKKKQAHYKVVVMEHTRKTTGKYLELLGWYNPHTSEIEVNVERLNHYLSNGAQMSATVNNLLITKGIIKGEKVTSWKPKKKPQKEEAAVEAPKEEAKPAEAPETEEKPAEEAPAEEIKEEAPAAEVEKTE
jgi:small subunit ribosomal protein S16